MHMRELYKLWMNCKIFCLKCLKTVCNKGQLTPILRNNECRSKFEKHEDFLQACCLCVNCTFVTGV